jgi:hypothetical protein
MELIKNTGTIRKGKYSYKMAIFLCSFCGKEVEKRAAIGKRDKSCGCARYKKSHGETSNGRTRLYVTWQSMKYRCDNKNHKSYKDYGAKGIKVCDEWYNFSVFKEWAINNGYNDILTIDRKLSDRNYCPENCHFISLEANSIKRKGVVLNFEKACEIREKKASGSSFSHLSNEYSVSISHVRDIVNMKKWSKKY